MPIPELLAPAGDPEKLETALLYGADAVYLGGPEGNLRAACRGFSPFELARGLDLAKRRGARVYYCLNSFPREADLARLPARIEECAALGVHAFIVADPGVLRLARRYAPGIAVHLSTQANTANSEALRFWQEQGVSRANLARELSCREIYALRRACPDMELEVFVHGAMCLAVSGQCLLSAWLNNRPANAGRCTQPCRFEYRALGLEPSLEVEEATRPGEPLWSTGRQEGYAALFAPDDLCLIRYIPWFCRIGAHALKIEGRMKSAAYVAQVVDAYRAALDGARRPGEMRMELCLPELLHSSFRPLSTGFFVPGERRYVTWEGLRKPGPACREKGGSTAGAREQNAAAAQARPVVGRVVEAQGAGRWVVDVRANWRTDADVEVLLPGLRRPWIAAGTYGLENQRGERSVSVGSGIRGVLCSDFPDLEPGVFLRAVECGIER